MVIVNMNIIFTFPFNDWDNLFIEDEKLNITPICLCSQEISKDIMERYNWDDKDIEKLKNEMLEAIKNNKIVDIG